MQQWCQESFSETERLHVGASVRVCYLHVDKKLPFCIPVRLTSPRILCLRAALFISFASPPCKAQLSGPIHHPGTGWYRVTDQRADIWDNGLTGRKQCGVEKEQRGKKWRRKEQREGRMHTSHIQTHTSSLNFTAEKKWKNWPILPRVCSQGFYYLTGKQHCPRVVRLTCTTQLFFSSCVVIWQEINPAVIQQHLFFFTALKLRSKMRKGLCVSIHVLLHTCL